MQIITDEHIMETGVGTADGATLGMVGLWVLLVLAGCCLVSCGV